MLSRKPTDTLPNSLHPTQGSFPVLKLVAQPPLQLLLSFSSLASFPKGEPGPAMIASVVAGDAGAVGLRTVDDVRRDATTRSSLCGLAACFGATTVMVGSEAAPVAVCEVAGPHSRIVDTAATAEGATKLDDNLMIMSSRGRTCRPNAYARYCT